MEDKKINNVLEQVQNVGNGINGVIIPMLKDTVADYRKTFNKLIALIIILIVVLAAVVGYSQYLIYKQNQKYEEFLSQFEFESETIYQDVDAGDGSDSIINDGISIQKDKE